MKKIYLANEELGFTIIAEPDSHHCDFTCYENAGFSQDDKGGYTVPLYKIKNYHSGTDNCEELESAQIYLHGGVKWDGCSNLHFDEQENVMLHFCGRKDIQQVGKLFERLYDLAAELIPNWDKENAG